LLSPFRLKDRLFYGWVVVATFFIAGTAIWGIRFSFGVFFKSIESEFDLTRAATSAVFSTLLVTGGACSILGGWAIDRYGPRIVLCLMGLFIGLGLLLTSQTSAAWQLFITYSLLLAIGSGATYVVIMSTVSRWFDKKRGLAVGLAGSGGGLGPLITAPFATYILIKFNWRIAFIIIGLIAWLVVIPISRLLKKSPYEIGALPDGVKVAPKDIKNNYPQSTGLSLREALGVRSFWIITFIYLFYSCNLSFIITHLVPHVTDVGFSAMEAATVLSLVGGAAIAGRVLMGIASDRIGKKFVAILCALLQSAAVLWLIWAKDFWMLQAFAIVFGFAYGGMSPSMASLISDTFGLGRIGTILGALEIGFGIGSAIGPALGGYIFDVNGSYTMAFLSWAVAMLITALITVLVRRERHIKARMQGPIS